MTWLPKNWVLRSALQQKTIKVQEVWVYTSRHLRKEMRKLILEEYTFLRRPLVIMGTTITAGATKDALAQLKDSSHG